ncbi:alpha/beta fold hydrolase [Patescibacteria group bacterium]|nr:alpha/beta fold hydrolase [Patescibacteria group bacterium]
MEKKVLAKPLKKVSTLDWRPAGAIGNVVFFHGYRSRMGMILPFLDTLANAGFNVFACDLPNHGTSVEVERERGSIKSFCDLLDTARAMVLTVLVSSSRRRMPTFIIGHSLGALITVRLLQSRPRIKRHVQGVVCVSMPFSVDHNVTKTVKRFRWLLNPLAPFLRRLFPNLPVDKPAFASDGRSIIEEDVRAMRDDLYYKGPLRLSTALEIRGGVDKAREEIGKLDIPLLFVHGEHDEVAPLGALEEIYPHIPSSEKELMRCHVMGHDILNESNEAVAHIVYWLKERLMGTPRRVL